MSSSRVTSATPRKRLDDLRQAPRVVDRHRHADLGRRHDVDRRAVLLEHLEDAPQEPVRHQHARRRDVDDGDALLRRDGRQRAGRRRAIARDQRADRISRPPGVEDPDGNVAARPPAESSPGAAPSRRNTRAPTPRRTTGAARPARRARCADRRSACRRRRSRSESRRRPGTRRRSRPSSPTRRARASSSRPRASRRRSRR